MIQRVNFSTFGAEFGELLRSSIEGLAKEKKKGSQKKQNVFSALRFSNCKIDWELLPTKFIPENDLTMAFIGCDIDRAEPVIEYCSQIKTLKVLNLQMNHLSEDELRKLSAAISTEGQLDHIKELHLNNSDVPEEVYLKEMKEGEEDEEEGIFSRLMKDNLLKVW